MLNPTVNKNYKSGMTLLEIVVSLAIFAIMSVGFYGMFSIVFINMYHTSQVTESAFLSQQIIEERIADVKLKLKNGLLDEVTEDRIQVTLFSGSQERSVYVYHLSENMINGKLVETLVAENRPPQLQVPVITSPIVINAKNGSSVITYPNVVNRDSYDIILEGGTPTVDNEGLLIQHLYYWYISRVGFYTPSQPPQFPDDYEILAGYTAKDIVTVPESFGGKFLKLVVTPVGEKGAMGTSVESNALFISPLNFTTNLLLHFDASLVNKNDSTEYLNDKVIKLNGINTEGTLTTSNNNRSPNLVTAEYGDSIMKRTFGAVRSSAGGTQTLTGTNSFTDKNNVTVYFVANFASSSGVSNGVNLLHTRSSNTQNRNKFILRTSTVSGNEGQLELIRYYGSNQTPSTVTNITNYRTDEWQIIKLEVYSNRLAIRHGVNNTDNVYSFINNVSNDITALATFYLTPFQINFAAGYTVGEIMIYDGVVSSTDEQSILKYLADKYQP